MRDAAPERAQELIHHLPRKVAVRGMKIGLSALAVAAVMVAGTEARADILAPGTKGIKATFELTGTEKHPDYMFVLFPFGVCKIDEEFFKLNPNHDTVEHNYEVLRAGQRYESQKFCMEGKIYAFKASEFKTEPLVLKEKLDFYRPEGYTITVIKGFDELKSSEKAKFVAQDKRVKGSGFSPWYPLVVNELAPFDSTHDVLRIAELSEASFRVEGVKVVLGSKSGQERDVAYENGQRPKELDKSGEIIPAALNPTANAATSPAASAAARAPGQSPAAAAAAPDESGFPVVLTGVGALAVVGLGLALLSRSKSGKKPS